MNYSNNFNETGTNCKNTQFVPIEFLLRNPFFQELLSHFNKHSQNLRLRRFCCLAATFCSCLLNSCFAGIKEWHTQLLLRASATINCVCHSLCESNSYHAGNGTRTHKGLLPHGPEPCASTNSAIPAQQEYHTLIIYRCQGIISRCNGLSVCCKHHNLLRPNSSL